MLKKIMVAGLAAVAFLTAVSPLWAQNYSNAVMALSPSAYWPLNETTQPTLPINLTAQNLGTQGAAANAFYGAWYQPSGVSYYLTNNIAQSQAYTYPFDGSMGMQCQGQAGQYVILPRNTNGVANTNITLNPPFSIECWLKIGTTNSALGCIVSQGGTVNLNTGGPTNYPFNGGLSSGWAGVELGQYQDYLFLLCQATNATGNKGSELDTSGYNQGKGFKIGAWVYVVATFDGSKESIYTNGVLCVSKTLGANAAGIKYVADPTSPLMIGGGSDVTAAYGQGYVGTIHDVAIYNALLPVSSMANHYQTANGTNGTYGSNYTNAVLADNPVLYYRLNDAVTKTNASYNVGSFPVANNYGSLGSSGNGFYQPGTTPGVPGPSFAGFGPQSTAVSFNGFLGSVDVGGGALPAALNPTNTAPLTVVGWFQSGPADSPGRYNAILSHGSYSYRMTLGTGEGENHFNPGPGPELSAANAADQATNGFAFNDGKWHMVAGVDDGTNASLYLDGILYKTSSNTNGIKILGTNVDMLIGGDPQYTYASFGTAGTIQTFDGQVAQVAFWNSALTSSNILQLYNAAEVPPYFTVEPVPTIVTNQGNNVSVGTTVRGSSTITYQWYKNGVAASGQKASSLVFTPAIASESGNYYLVASNSYGSATSTVVSVTIYGPPTISAQTSTQVEVFAGTSPTLHVQALGASPINYQWSFNGGAISGATNSAYTVVNAQNNGTYACSLSNFVGTASITPISFTVLSDPTAPFPVKVLSDSPIDYFRLDESSGTIAFDYAGANNGTYTNATLGVSGYTSLDAVQSDPSETAVEFGDYPPYNNDAGSTPPWLNFNTPNGSSAEFSIEAWFTEYEFLNGGNCIAAIGYGNGGEQFVLDSGAAGGDIRFFVRNAAGTAYGASGTYAPANDGKWHHVVGVCDEANGHVYVYLDGNLAGSGTIPVNSGLLSATRPLIIGSRESGNNGGTNDFLFYGAIDDVAVYNYALSAGQVANHYTSSGIPPTITSLLPGNQIVTNQGANLTLSVTVSGTTPYTYTWLDNNNNQIGTGPSVTLTNLQPANAGNYSVTVANAYGSEQTNASITVDLGPPQVTGDISPLYITNYVATPETYTVAVSGSGPFSFQWYQNNGKIIGATNSSYAFPIASGTNTYYCSITNAYSYTQGSGPTYSSTGLVVGIPVPTLNPSNYTDNVKISFNGYNRSEILQNFPVLVALGTNIPGFSYQHFASPTGGDLRFSVDNLGSRVLPSEIDEWNPNGTSYVWVQIPALSTNTSIYAFWGDPSAENVDATDTNGAVWLAPSWQGVPSYDIVYHLKESAFPYADSTLEFPSTNGIAPAPTNGIVGTGEFMNGAAYLDSGTVNLSNQFTLSAWVNLTGANDIQAVWTYKPGGYNSAGFGLYINSWTTSDGEVHLETGTGTAGAEASSSGSVIGSNAWHMLVATVDRGAGIAQFYVDGNAVPMSATGIRTDFPVTNDMRLGRFLDNSYPFHGTMDEARLRTGTNSPNWIWASYMTVASNANFTTFSSITSTWQPPVVLNAQMVGNQLVLTWSSGTLQSAATANGPYSNVTGATSPYTVTPTGSARFYRVKVH